MARSRFVVLSLVAARSLFMVRFRLMARSRTLVRSFTMARSLSLVRFSVLGSLDNDGALSKAGSHIQLVTMLMVVIVAVSAMVPADAATGMRNGIRRQRSGQQRHDRWRRDGGEPPALFQKLTAIFVGVVFPIHKIFPFCF